MAQVKIGPSFFAKAKSDYANWQLAWVRELAQNSMDAPGCTAIEFTYHKDGDHTIATCENNGRPMDENTLVNKFLALGESGKNFQGSVGGFGKAKELIAFTHENYQIRTGNLLVQGSGADYELTAGLPHYHGTKTTVHMTGDHVEKLTNNTKLFAAFAQWHGTILLTTDKGTDYLPTKLRKGTPRRDLGYATVYTNKVYKNRIIVRIDGIPMFHNYTSYDRCVIVELKGNSAQTLTANRDGLRYPYSSELTDFIAELATDKRTALRQTKAEYRHYNGPKHTIAAFNTTNLLKDNKNTDETEIHSEDDLNEQTDLDNPKNTEEARTTVQNNDTHRPTGRGIEVTSRTENTTPIHLGGEFILKNNTTLKIPNHYLPETFGTYSTKLARIWAKLLIQLHKTTKTTGNFAIGFILDPDCAAEHEEGDYGKVYYINPAIIVQQKNSKSRSLKNRFKLTDRDTLLSYAVHEYVHGLGHTAHDENYAAALTETFATVMKHRKDFNPCFT